MILACVVISTSKKWLNFPDSPQGCQPYVQISIPLKSVLDLTDVYSIHLLKNVSAH